ncbi:RidA family protein [Paenibacillus solisilvae]|uniref:RidA family protein n=1 Tax=Paenibacillus solisilvae TaxID=2486751 RepID=A0ABW0VQR6_9BACL
MNLPKKVKLLIGAVVISSFVCVSAFAAQEDPATPSKYPSEPIKEVDYYGSPTSSISSAVAVPAGSSTFSTSGTVPPLLNKDGKTIYERYGNTKTQGVGILKEIEKQLKEQGLTLADVAYLRVYVAEDAGKENKFDFDGWFQAYAQFFNTPANPVKPARSTVGVAALVNPDWLIEIEAVAVYPKHRNQD